MQKELEFLSVPQLLEKVFLDNPDKEAIYDRTRRMSYRELWQESDQLAAALSAWGIQKGDRVGVCLPNWHETVVLYFALGKVGAILVPFNPKYRIHEVQHIIQNSGVKSLFISGDFDQQMLNVIAPMVQNIATVRFRREEFIAYTELLARGEAELLPLVDIEPSEDVYCILYTSGTTGSPKGAMLTHRALTLSGIGVSGSIKGHSDDVYLVPAPLFHIFGMGPNLMGAVSTQARMVLMDKYRPQEALELIQQEKVTVHHAVPAMYIMELNHPSFASYDLSTLRAGMTGGAPCPAETIRAVRERMKMEISVSYGLSEAGSVTMTEYGDEFSNILETIGKALPGVELQIVDDARVPLPLGQVGEIACRGFAVMKGYYQAPEQTKQVLDQEGWFYTGDLGSMDAKGYIRFIGRKKELIIRGGYNIYPREIEEILYQNDKIMEAAVIGLPDPVMGESVCAVIRLKDDADSSSDELKDYIKQYVADYKLPNQFIFAKEFPVTASGKIQKLKIREQLIEQMSV